MKPRSLLVFTLIISLICFHLNYAQDDNGSAGNVDANNNANALPSTTTTSSTTSTTTTSTTTSTTAPATASTNETSQAQQDDGSPQATLDQETNAHDILPTVTVPLLSNAEADELTGGGVWSSIGLVAVVICGCICLERLYSSCKKVYQKRTGRYGFSRLQNQTFNEFEDDDDDDDDGDDDLEESLGRRMTTAKNHTQKDSDQDSV